MGLLVAYSMWDIIYTFHNKPIHLEHLQNSNPNANIFLCDISEYNEYLDPIYCWGNSDIFIRNWLRSNRSKITNKNIAIIEWDVLVTMELPAISIDGLYCKNIQYPSNSNWYWFNQSKLLRKYEPYRIGITPFAVLFMDQKCIDVLLDNEFDPIFSCNLFCELRLPTVLNSKNINITRYPMPHIFATQHQHNITSGIYHPIKFPVP